MSEELRIEKLYNLSETIAAELFEGLDYPWQALPLIGEFIKKLGRTLDKSEYDETAENVWIPSPPGARYCFCPVTAIRSAATGAV